MLDARSSKSIDYLTSLPPELLCMVTKHLSLVEFACLAQTNHAMRNTYSLQAKEMYLKDQVWVSAIQSAGIELIVETSDGNVFAKNWIADTFRLLYQKEKGETLLAQDESYFVLKNGEVKAWGNNTDGQLGLAGGTYIAEPETIAIDGPVSQVVPAGSFTYFLLKNGTVMACGLNDHGQIGMGQRTPGSPLAFIPGLFQVKKISASADSVHALFLLENGKVKSCGMNNWGQLGQGRKGDFFTPQLISGLTDVRDIVAGPSSFFILNNGTVKSCGFNPSQNLGYQTLARMDGFSPKLIPDLNHVSKVRAGYHRTVFILDDGSMKWAGIENNRPLHLLGQQYTEAQAATKAMSNIHDMIVDEVAIRYNDTRVLILCQDHYGQIQVASKFNPFTVNAIDPSAVDIYLRGMVKRAAPKLQKCLAGASIDDLLVMIQRHEAYGENCFQSAIKAYQQAQPPVLTRERILLLQSSPWFQLDNLRETFPAYDALVDCLNTHHEVVRDGIVLAYSALYALFCCLHYRKATTEAEQNDFKNLIRILSFDDINPHEWKAHLNQTRHLYPLHQYQLLGMKLFDHRCSQLSDYIVLRTALKEVPLAGLQLAAAVLRPAVLKAKQRAYLA